MTAVLAALAFAACPPPAPPPSVVLVTLDGVRAREVFHGPDPVLLRGGPPDVEPAFPRLWARLGGAAGGFATGDRAGGDPFRTPNRALTSLPGYQELLAGRDTGCRDNGCPRVRVETVLERALRELGAAPGEVAVFASWPAVARAVARADGTLSVNAGLDAPEDAGTDPVAAALDRAQRADRPPWGYRRDRYTWALAMRHLERHRPRLLYVALGDADEWAHRGDYRAYLAALREADALVDGLLARLQAMGPAGAATSVVVTTDHGRGEGAAWSRHGRWQRGSDEGWLFAHTPATAGSRRTATRGPYDALHVRPTVEALLGLAPCAGCRRPVAEVVPPPPTCPRAPARPTKASRPRSAWNRRPSRRSSRSRPATRRGSPRRC